MKYNGIELEEMTSEKWDGKSREMLVWVSGDKEPKIKRVIGFDKGFAIGFKIGEDDYYLAYDHCAEIPTEEKEDAMKLLIDNENEILDLKEENEKLKAKVNELKNSCSYQTYCGMCNVKVKLEDKIENLKAEKDELKARIKTLSVERGKMANAVSGAVWKELMDRAYKDSYIGVPQMPTGFGFNDISDIVLNKIIDYKLENKTRKKTHVMTNKELAEWLAKGNGVWAWSNYATGVVGDSTTHKTIWEYRNENADEPCTTNLENCIRIKGWDETKWREPLIEE